MNKATWTAMALALVLVGCGDGTSTTNNNSPPPVNGAPPTVGNGPATGVTKYDSAKATAKITGKVVWGGGIVKARSYNMTSKVNCDKMHTAPVMQENTVVGKAGNGLQYAVVYVTKGHERFTFEKGTSTHLVDQKGCVYLPHTVAVQLGDKLKLTSQDTEKHNIRLKARKLKNLNRTVEKGETFTYEPDRVEEKGARLVCDIHSWMGCNLHVFGHPFFAITGPDGSFSIKVPPGEYTVKVFHENEKGLGKWKWAAKEPEATVKAEKDKDASVTFTYNKKKK